MDSFGWNASNQVGDDDKACEAGKPSSPREGPIDAHRVVQVANPAPLGYKEQAANVSEPVEQAPYSASPSAAPHYTQGSYYSQLPHQGPSEPSSAIYTWVTDQYHYAPHHQNYEGMSARGTDVPIDSQNHSVIVENPEDTYQTIGAVLTRKASRGRKFKCIFPGCKTKGYNRPSDLERHYKAQHSNPKPEFWCPYANCIHSQESGSDPFRRYDKRNEHVALMHQTIS